MHELYELKDMLCSELEEYGGKNEITAASLDIIDKLAHAVKNIDKIIEMSEDDGGKSYRGYSRRSMNYGRGRRNSYADGKEMIEQLENMMDSAPDDRTRQEIQRLITKMQSM